MLIGHYAPALVLQRVRPSVKLWPLFVATQFVDVLWGIFILTGVEHARIVPGFTSSNDLDLYDMPYTHSLVATAAWAAVAFVAWRSRASSRTPPPPRSRRGPIALPRRSAPAGMPMPFAAPSG